MRAPGFQPLGRRSQSGRRGQSPNPRLSVRPRGLIVLMPVTVPDLSSRPFRLTRSGRCHSRVPRRPTARRSTRGRHELAHASTEPAEPSREGSVLVGKLHVPLLGFEHTASKPSKDRDRLNERQAGQIALNSRIHSISKGSSSSRGPGGGAARIIGSRRRETDRGGSCASFPCWPPGPRGRRPGRVL